MFIRATFAAVTFLLAACATTPIAPPLPANAAIDAEAQRLMAREHVNGMAIAVIDNGEVVHVAAFGHRNVEQNLPLQTDTIMYGASLTKAAFAYMVTAAGRRRPSRSRSFDRGLPAAPAARIRRLLRSRRRRTLAPADAAHPARAHERLRQHALARRGSDASASTSRLANATPIPNEGFWVLQIVLEEGLGLDVGAEMQRRMFDRFGMTRTSMQWRDDFAGNLADGYAMDGTFEPHDGATMSPPPARWIRRSTIKRGMWAGIVCGEGLSPASRAELVRATLRHPHRRSSFRRSTGHRSARPGDQPLRRPGRRHVRRSTSGRTWFKGGHNEWTGNMVDVPGRAPPLRRLLRPTASAPN